MCKSISKDNFMKKLNLYLSFSICYDECKSILNDYEEWFEQEMNQGKNELQICQELDEPRKIARRYVSEVCSRKNVLLFRSKIIQIFLLLVLHPIINFFALTSCNRYGIEYVYFAICSNFVFFFIGMYIVKNTVKIQKYTLRKILFLVGLLVLIVAFEITILNLFDYYRIGQVYTTLLFAVVFLIICFNVYVWINECTCNIRLGYVTIFYCSCVITSIFSCINQTHMFYNDVSVFYHKTISQSIWIVIQSAICLVLLCNYKKNKELR